MRPNSKATLSIGLALVFWLVPYLLAKLFHIAVTAMMVWLVLTNLDHPQESLNRVLSFFRMNRSPSRRFLESSESPKITSVSEKSLRVSYPYSRTTLLRKKRDQLVELAERRSIELDSSSTKNKIVDQIMKSY